MKDTQPTSRGASGDEASLDRLIDRLVDGELTPDAYRQTLASLDDHADGWRRCALAFLEAQALSQELRQTRADWERVDWERADWEFDDANASPRGLPQQANALAKSDYVNRAPRTQPMRRVLGLLITTAASFGLALALGLSVGDYFAASRQQIESPAPKELVGSLAESTGRPRATAEDPLEAREPNWAEAGKSVALREPRPSGEYLFAVEDAAGPREFELPIYDGRDLNERELAAWFAKTEPRETSRLIDLIRQAGHGVRTRRALAPIDLQNGEQAFAPALEVEITPVGRSIQ